MKYSRMPTACLFLVALCLFAKQGKAQIVKGLAYGKLYTVERVAEIHADKEVNIVNHATYKVVKVRLSDKPDHYLLLELDNYTALKGGKLNRIMLSGGTLGEAERMKLFRKGSKQATIEETPTT